MFSAVKRKIFGENKQGNIKRAATRSEWDKAWDAKVERERNKARAEDRKAAEIEPYVTYHKSPMKSKHGIRSTIVRGIEITATQRRAKADMKAEERERKAIEKEKRKKEIARAEKERAERIRALKDEKEREHAERKQLQRDAKITRDRDREYVKKEGMKIAKSFGKDMVHAGGVLARGIGKWADGVGTDIDTGERTKRKTRKANPVRKTPRKIPEIKQTGDFYTIDRPIAKTAKVKAKRRAKTKNKKTRSDNNFGWGY